MGAPYIHDISHLRVKQPHEERRGSSGIDPCVFKLGTRLRPLATRSGSLTSYGTEWASAKEC